LAVYSIQLVFPETVLIVSTIFLRVTTFSNEIYLEVEEKIAYYEIDEFLSLLAKASLSVWVSPILEEDTLTEVAYKE